MDESWSRLQQLIKRGLAAALFIVVVVGGSAAAFCAFAAAMTALSGRPEVALVPTHEAVQSSGNATTADSTGSTSPMVQTPAEAQALPAESASSPAQTTTSSVLSDGGTDGYYSPVGDAIDTGGVVLGTRIQRAFGSLLSGVLQTLFLTQKQPTTTTDNTAKPSGESQSTSGAIDTGVGQP